MPLSGLRNFSKVVGRNVCCHTNSNTDGTVNEEIREPTGKNAGFTGSPVIVVLEINRVLFNIPNHLHGQLSHFGLGITRGCRSIISWATKVALAGSQRVAHAPRLNQPDQSIINCTIAMGVEFTHHVTHHTGALGERFVRAVTTVKHGVDHSPVNGL